MITKIANYLSGFTFKFWLAVCAVLLGCVPVAYCKGVSDGKAIESAEHERIAREAAERAREADDEASVQREADNIRNQENEDARNDAISSDGRTGLNCERLRRAHPVEQLEQFPEYTANCV